MRSEEEPRIYSVGELTRQLRNHIRSERTFWNVYVRGELTGFSKSKLGHCYFSLKDEKAKLNCVIFKDTADQMELQVKDGQEVVVVGDIDVYEMGGYYQLKVKELRPIGMGEAFLALEKLKGALAEEGLFREEYKKRLPAFPKRIGVVTSEKGAAFRDILKVLRRRYPIAQVVLAPAIVQGNMAPPSIVKGIQMLNRLDDIDVMIVGRGGGSVEDLWCFNDETVARAVFASSIPVVSAVGHETDVTLTDFVADKRAPTPSAAAEIVTPDVTELRDTLEQMKNQILTEMREILAGMESAIATAKKKIRPAIITDRLAQYDQRLDELYRRLEGAGRNLIEFSRGRLEKAGGMLGTVSPLGTLDRGFSVALKMPERTIIKSVESVSPGDDALLMVKDGDIDCRVEKTRKVERWKES